MPYYPKSQVKTNLYTNGDELVDLLSGEDYKGFYWVNSKNEFYAGKNPQEIPLIPLTKQDSDEADESPTLRTKFSYWADELPNNKSEEDPGLSPNKYTPSPSASDYSLGQFERYFTKKSNQNIYYEISKEDFEALQSKDKRIKWQIYEPIKLAWQLTGDKETVYNTNRNIVFITEQKDRLPGFSKIFRKDYLQYYK